MKRRIYLCEGETEQRLVKALIEGELIAPGQQRVFNTAQNDVKKMLRRWGWGPVKFVLVVDADTGPYDMSPLYPLPDVSKACLLYTSPSPRDRL